MERGGEDVAERTTCSHKVREILQSERVGDVEDQLGRKGEHRARTDWWKATCWE